MDIEGQSKRGGTPIPIRPAVLWVSISIAIVVLSVSAVWYYRESETVDYIMRFLFAVTLFIYPYIKSIIP